MGRDYSPILRQRFEEPMLRWLGTLPDEGWTGTPTDLAAALADAAKPREYVGRKVVSAVKASAALAVAGFELVETRTASRRLVTIRRA
jgi:hypothetical protein